MKRIKTFKTSVLVLFKKVSTRTKKPQRKRNSESDGKVTKPQEKEGHITAKNLGNTPFSSNSYL